MTQKNIAFLLWSGVTFGGAERRYARLAAYLASSRSNCQITLYCPVVAIASLEMLDVDLSEIKVIELDSGQGNRFISKLRKCLLLLRLPFSIFKGKYHHFFIAGNPGAISYIVTRFSPILPSTSVAMVDISYDARSSWLDRYFTRNTLRKVCSVDCLSEAVKFSFSKSIDPLDIKKISIAPCSFSDFSKVRDSHLKDIDIAMIGRFVPFKGHELLEKIAAKLVDLELHVCGFGALQLNIPGAKIYNAVDPFDVLSRARISLSLQFFGNYPSQVLLESMASGCAIIATDTGETRKLLDDSCAVLIPYDSDALLAAIVYLLSNPDRCDVLGKAAKNRVLTEHNIERYADYFVNEVISEALQS